MISSCRNCHFLPENCLARHLLFRCKPAPEDAMSRCATVFTALVAVCSLGVAGPPPAEAAAFVRRQGAMLMVGDARYCFGGTNYWYGVNLAMAGPDGDRARLRRELDVMAEHGLVNLRIMAGSEGPDAAPWRLRPGLQTAPGVYNDDVRHGLD
jgi:hypothetical protein